MEVEGPFQRVRSGAQRLRSSTAGLYANMAEGAARWWHHPYVKPAAAAAVAGFILCSVLVVAPLSVSLGHCNMRDLTPGPTPTGPTPGPTPAGPTPGPTPAGPTPGPTPGPNPEIPCGMRVPVGPTVINGDQASPWMAFVQDQRGYFKGNAALIHKYFVVTADDAVVSPGDIVVLGAHNRSDTSEVTRQEFVIEAVFIHPNLSANLPFGGMRLAKLYRPVNFNKYNRVCPPKRHFIPAAGSSCKLVGWGRTNDTGTKDLLHEGSPVIISNDQCKRDMPYTYYHKYITNATFCTAVDETHPTWEDRGSPLLCEQEKGVFGVYGVLFYPGSPGRFPSLFYNVTVMDSWMDELFPQYNAE